MCEIELKQATLSHLDIVTRYSDLMNEEDGHPASPNNKKALRDLINTPDWGMVKLITLEQKVIGYICVCYGYSIEYGGRDVALDEIYIEPEHRGYGYGAQAIKCIEKELVRMGFISFYLAVTPENKTARAMYKKLGFEPMQFDFWAKFYG